MSAFETTLEQRRQLKTDGFVLLSNAIPAELLARWRDLATRLESDAIRAHERSESLRGACVIESLAGPQLIRFDDIIAVDFDAVLDLLACPAMLAVAGISLTGGIGLWSINKTFAAIRNAGRRESEMTNDEVLLIAHIARHSPSTARDLYMTMPAGWTYVALKKKLDRLTKQGKLMRYGRGHKAMYHTN